MLLFRHQLRDYYPDGEIRNIFYLCAEHLLNYSKIDIHEKGQDPISGEIVEKFNQVLVRLKNWEPIQYITGSTEFYGLVFQVDKRVLIPRPETEELVAWILSTEKGRAPAILDIGTGSGCIAVSLAANLPGASVSACDISEDALEVALSNVRINEVEVDLFVYDLFNGQTLLPSRYQLMVSNPPYVREMEKMYMRKNVLDHEPGIALYVPDDDPLCCYRGIALLGRKFLKDGGYLYLEINENYPQEITKILENAGFYGIEIRSDLNGKPRMVKASK